MAPPRRAAQPLSRPIPTPGAVIRDADAAKVLRPPPPSVPDAGNPTGHAIFAATVEPSAAIEPEAPAEFFVSRWAASFPAFAPALRTGVIIQRKRRAVFVSRPATETPFLAVTQ